MMELLEIRARLQAGSFEFTRHAFKRAVERDIADAEIREAGRMAEIIENYPADKYTPSCLLLGFTIAGRPLHLQVSLKESDAIKIITVYEPDPLLWVDYSRRR